ncbi:hypothetical protein OG562_14715 [Streptomyces sp. NBC_01275]|uniref:hypothetical protein n=1 Tax=Streptomyces sp. NBC_01275 TaxID=2903807 RepID=UPI00225C106F|nr:hypothetical protein [Streptomyces sp. NBC_01275]MCX4762204.1 hypothetical protein [Streptomyces sp. NBC_01275]
MTLVADVAPVPVRAEALRAEALRGFAPWAGFAVLLTVAVLLGGSADRWQGGWAETRSELHDALLIVLPLAAAAGCWQGGRERRRRTEELWGTAVRGPLARFLVSALPVGLWAAGGYLVAAGGAMVATWAYARGDQPYVGLLAADAVTLVGGAVAGQVVGRLVPWRLAAPVLAMAGFVVLGVVGSARSGSGRLLDPAFSVGVGTVPVGWQPGAMAVWTGGLAAAAVLAYAARRRYTALLPLAAATAAGVLLVQTGDGLWQPNPAGRGQVCDTSTTPQVCVNARYRGLLPQVTAALSGVTGRLDGVRNLPVRFEDRPGSPRRGEAELPMLTPMGWSFVRGRLTNPERYAWEAVMALQNRADCAKAPDARVSRADDAVENYLAPSPAQTTFDELAAEGDKADRAELAQRRAARARLAAMGADERRTWLSAYFATARDCDAKGVPAL